MPKTLTLLLASFGLLLAACAPQGPADDGTGPIKIGMSLPLTGEAASFGEGGVAGATLAMQEINEAGGINGRNIELIIEDDRCTKDGVNTITKLIDVDRVVVIAGPVCSAAAGPALPIAQEAKVPTIFWGSAPHLPTLGDYLFRTYPSDAFQGKFAAEYIFNTLEKKRAAVLYVQNDWGQGLRDVFTKRFEELGGTIVFNEGAPQDTGDLRTPLTKLKAADPDVVYFPVYPALGIVGLKQARVLGINIPIIGGDAFDTEEVISTPEAEGAIYTLAKFQNPDAFKEKIKLATGTDSNFMTPLAYDAIYILAQSIDGSSLDQKAIRNALAKLSYTDAVALPLIEFDENGDLNSAEFEVRIIRNGKSEVYE